MRVSPEASSPPWSDTERAGEYVGTLDRFGQATLIRWGRSLAPGTYHAVLVGDVDGEPLDAAGLFTIAANGQLAVQRRPLSSSVFVERQAVGVDVVVRPAGRKAGDRVEMRGRLVLARRT